MSSPIFKKHNLNMPYKSHLELPYIFVKHSLGKANMKIILSKVLENTKEKLGQVLKLLEVFAF
jgi:hypothetical protein